MPHQILSKFDQGIRMCFPIYNSPGALLGGWQKQFIIKCNAGQPGGSTLISEIIIWFALRIKKALRKEAMEENVTVMIDIIDVCFK